VAERVAKQMEMLLRVGGVIRDGITKYVGAKCGVEQVEVVVVARSQARSYLPSERELVCAVVGNRVTIPIPNRSEGLGRG